MAYVLNISADPNRRQGERVREEITSSKVWQKLGARTGRNRQETKSRQEEAKGKKKGAKRGHGNKRCKTEPWE